MEERKAYKVELTDGQKERLDIFLSLMNDFECSNGGERVELREIEREDTKEDKFPRIGDKYFYVSVYGDVLDTTFVNDAYDRDAIKIDNCFRTKEEAEFELERLKVIAEMKKFAESEDREWNRYDIDHWCFCYEYGYKKVGITNYNTIKHSDIYFETREKAQECIDRVGKDRIKKYYLRMED